VKCVEEIEFKYWEEGVPSTYHKESIRTSDSSDDDHTYHVRFLTFEYLQINAEKM